MDINLPKNGDLYGDAAYINQQYKDLLLQFNQIRLKAATKKNSLIKILGRKNLKIDIIEKLLKIHLLTLPLNSQEKSMQ